MSVGQPICQMRFQKSHASIAALVEMKQLWEVVSIRGSKKSSLADFIAATHFAVAGGEIES